MDLERIHFTDEQKLSAVSDYIFGKYTLNEVAERHGCSRSAVYKWIRERNLKCRSQGHHMLGNANLWRNGMRTTTQGYIQIHWRHPEVEEKFYGMAGQPGYIMMHRLVMARFLDRPLTGNEQVHHKDGNRQNNSIDNLQLRIGNHGAGVVYRCCDCGSHNVVAEVI